ncbi:MAG: sialate O-acetylesterase [Spirochaetaceae bacterium]|jgi:sialate O-acetylesterase|nr:sialate O-acetylesterase [Spirochaetaceae bacterium]
MIISDGAVLQQGKATPLWGKTTAGADIRVEFRGNTYSGKADGAGNWQIAIDTGTYGGPFSLNLNGKTLKDIYVGDLWLCSGQSNMEMPMQQLRDNYPAEWTEEKNGDIFSKGIVRAYKVLPKWDFTSPYDELDEAVPANSTLDAGIINCAGKWQPASPENLKDFSGTAWFFAKALYQSGSSLGGHPIGLVDASLGGAPVESFISEEALAPWPSALAQAVKYKNSSIIEEEMHAATQAQADWMREAREKSPKIEEMDNQNWESISLPGPLLKNGKVFHGVVYLKRSFSLPQHLAALEDDKHQAKLWLGTIVDADTVYINGKRVGETGYRYPARKYDIPKGVLQTGENEILIRVECQNDIGEVTRGKPFRLFFTDNTLCGPEYNEHFPIGNIELAGTWQACFGDDMPPIPPGFFVQWKPLGLYNAMIHPVLRSAYKGVIWYQGESNSGNAQEYTAMFQAMVQCWRKRAVECGNTGVLPFFFVQLPLFREPATPIDLGTGNDTFGDWASLREAQTACLEIPDTGMACALDAGEWNDLHPLNKKTIGERLALAAIEYFDKSSDNSPGPLLQDAHIESGALILNFIHCDGGLEIRSPVATPGGGVLEHPDAMRLVSHPYLIIKDAEGKIEKRPVGRTSPNQLVADASGLKPPLSAYYAWANNPVGRFFYSDAGLPMLPFRVTVGTRQALSLP